MIKKEKILKELQKNLEFQKRALPIIKKADSGLHDFKCRILTLKEEDFIMGQIMWVEDTDSYLFLTFTEGGKTYQAEMKTLEEVADITEKLSEHFPIRLVGFE